MELLGDMGHVGSRLSPFGEVLILMLDWCMVCAKHTIGSEIILDTPEGAHG
jgi:hypothetical protein